MIDDALKSGAIGQDTLSSSRPVATPDRAGIRRRGARLEAHLTMPETMSTERRKLLKILGAKLVSTEGPKGKKKRRKLPRRRASPEIPTASFSSSSPILEPGIHRRTTAEERLARTRWPG